LAPGVAQTDGGDGFCMSVTEHFDYNNYSIYDYEVTHVMGVITCQQVNARKLAYRRSAMYC